MASIIAAFRTLLYDEHLAEALQTARPGVGGYLAAFSAHGQGLMVVIVLSLLYATIALLATPAVSTFACCAPASVQAWLYRKIRGARWQYLTYISIWGFFTALILALVITGLVMDVQKLNSQVGADKVNTILDHMETMRTSLVEAAEKASTLTSSQGAVIQTILEGHAQSHSDLRPFIDTAQSVIRESVTLQSDIDRRLIKIERDYPSLRTISAVSGIFEKIRSDMNSMSQLANLNELDTKLSDFSGTSAGNRNETIDLSVLSSALDITPADRGHYGEVMEKLEMGEKTRFGIVLSLLIMIAVVTAAANVLFFFRFNRYTLVFASVATLLIAFVWLGHVYHLSYASVVGAGCAQLGRGDTPGIVLTRIGSTSITLRNVGSMLDSCARRGDLMVAFYDAFDTGKTAQAKVGEHVTLDYQKKTLTIRHGKFVLTINVDAADRYALAIQDFVRSQASSILQSSNVSKALNESVDNIDGFHKDLAAFDFASLNRTLKSALEDVKSMDNTINVVRLVDAQLASEFQSLCNTSKARIIGIRNKLDSLARQKASALRSLSGLKSSMLQAQAAPDSFVDKILDPVLNRARKFAREVVAPTMGCQDLGLEASAAIDVECRVGLGYLDWLHAILAMLAVALVVVVGCMITVNKFAEGKEESTSHGSNKYYDSGPRVPPPSPSPRRMTPIQEAEV